MNSYLTRRPTMYKNELGAGTVKIKILINSHANINVIRKYQ